MSEINDIDFEEDQQQLIEKTDIQTLASYCNEQLILKTILIIQKSSSKKLKEEADKIGSEIIPNLLAEQGLASLKLADGSSVDIKKSYNCTIKKDQVESAFKWLRDNGLGDLIKNEVAVQFGKGEDNKAEQLLGLAVQEGQSLAEAEGRTYDFESTIRERIESLDMPSDFFHTFVKDQTKIGRKS